MEDNKDKSTEEGFSFADIQEFDEHISKSIIGYDGLIQDVVALSEYFVEDGSKVYDLGCSTGKLVKAMASSYPKATIIGIENEENFKPTLKTKDNSIFYFEDVFKSSLVDASLITSVFTLQFLPLHRRQELLNKIYNSLYQGGAFILTEKMLLQNSKIDNMLTFIYYSYKRTQFTDSSILEKERSLRHMMKLLSVEDYVTMLRKAGFTKIEVFWRRYNFTGIVAIK